MKKDKSADTTVKFGDITLPVNSDPNAHTPIPQEIVGYKNVLNTLAFSVSKNLPALIIGETGLGKTALIRHLAYKTNNGFRRLNLNGQTTVDEFVGRTLLNKEGTYWQDGVLTDALRNGYWLLLDEINAALPEILFVLHSLLDDDRFIVIPENGGEIVRPHPNFRIFATMNPSGKYHGTKDLNKAFLSRFPIIVQLEYPNSTEEAKIIRSYANIKEQDAINLSEMAVSIRESYFKDEIDTICSTRDLINCARMSEDIGMRAALELSVLNRASKEDSKAIKAVVSLYFGGKDDKATAEEFSTTQLVKVSTDFMTSSLKFFDQVKKRTDDLATYMNGPRVDTTEVIQHLNDNNKLLATFVKNQEAAVKLIDRYSKILK